MKSYNIPYKNPVNWWNGDINIKPIDNNKINDFVKKEVDLDYQENALNILLEDSCGIPCMWLKENSVYIPAIRKILLNENNIDADESYFITDEEDNLPIDIIIDFDFSVIGEYKIDGFKDLSKQFRRYIIDALTYGWVSFINDVDRRNPIVSNYDYGNGYVLDILKADAWNDVICYEFYDENGNFVFQGDLDKYHGLSNDELIERIKEIKYLQTLLEL